MTESEKQPLIEQDNGMSGNNTQILIGQTAAANQNHKSEPEVKSVPIRCFFVAPVVFFHSFAYSLIQITMTQYAYASIYEMRYPNETVSGSAVSTDATCGTVNTSSEFYIHQQNVQAETSLFNIYCSLASNGPAIVANLFMGPLSDKFGRKFVFIIALVGTFGRSLANVCGIYYKLNIYIFVAFYGMEGMCGLWMCTLNTSHSYVADITGVGKQRSFGMALIEICLGLGVTLGTLVSGYIITGLGFEYPMVVSCACALMAIIVTSFVLIESVKKSDHKSPTVCQNFYNTISFYVDDNTGSRWRYILCLAVIFLVVLSNTGRTNVDTLYELNSPFCWDSVLIGWYATLRSMCHIVIGIGSVRLFQFCLSDESIAMVGSISFIGSAVQEALATTDVVLFTVPLTGAGSIMSAPMIRGIMSRMTPADKQGAMFAGIAAAEAICSLAGSVSTNAIYGATVNFFRGLVFLILGGYNVIVLILLVILKLGGSSSVYSRDDMEIVIARKQYVKSLPMHDSNTQPNHRTPIRQTKSYSDIFSMEKNRR